METLRLLIGAISHQTFAWMQALAPPSMLDATTNDSELARDRGAVSLEQVLWFVAAAVTTAVVAGILWNTIIKEANDTTVLRPKATTGG